MEKGKLYLYETTVKKQVKETTSEKRDENGQEITVSKDIINLKPIKIALLKPNRKISKSSEIFYAKRLSNYLKEGLLPHSLVAKRYLNDGGPLSDDAKKAVKLMRDKDITLQLEYINMKTPLSEEDSKRRSTIILERNEIYRFLQEIENSYSEIFENTAEAKSKSDTIEWWILQLSLLDIDEKGYKPIFEGEEYEDKIKKLDELSNQDDDFTNEIIRKLSYFVSFWFSASTNLTDENFKEAEENYNLTGSTYLPEPKVEEKLPDNNTDKLSVNNLSN